MAEWCALPESVNTDNLLFKTFKGKTTYFRFGIKVSKGVVRIPVCNRLVEVEDDQLVPLPVPEKVRKTCEWYEQWISPVGSEYWLIVSAYTGEPNPLIDEKGMSMIKLLLEENGCLLLLITQNKQTILVIAAAILIALGYAHVALVFFFIQYRNFKP